MAFLGVHVFLWPGNTRNFKNNICYSWPPYSDRKLKQKWQISSVTGGLPPLLLNFPITFCWSKGSEQVSQRRGTAPTGTVLSPRLLRAVRNLNFLTRSWCERIISMRGIDTHWPVSSHFSFANNLEEEWLRFFLSLWPTLSRNEYGYEVINFMQFWTALGSAPIFPKPLISPNERKNIIRGVLHKNKTSEASVIVRNGRAEQGRGMTTNCNFFLIFFGWRMHNSKIRKRNCDMHKFVDQINPRRPTERYRDYPPYELLHEPSFSWFG